MSELLAGYAEVDYTPRLGLPLRGQQRTRLAERVHDPLTANAAALRSGDETVVMVSVDICFLPSDFAKEVQSRFGERTGIAGERLLVHATHSHVAPVAMTYHWGEAAPDFVEKLREDVVGVAVEAVGKLEPVTAFSGMGELEHLGWNRRGMFADGSSAMHTDCRKPGFIGSEGPRDPHFGVLFTRNVRGAITGVIASFSTHPNSVENETYYSADIPGEFRRQLKSLLGPQVTVAYLTGPAGNVSPRVLEPWSPDQPWMGEEGLKRSGLYMAGEAAKIIASATEPIADPVLRFEHAELAVPVRPFPEEGERCYPSFWTDESRDYYMGHKADWPRRMREESPVEVRLNVVRVGDTVICTNPCELFVEFGLAIRDASPARVTIIGQLFDGYVGYCPTPLAFTRGGYETWPCQTSLLAPEAGDRIVEATRALLRSAYGGERQ